MKKNLIIFISLSVIAHGIVLAAFYNENKLPIIVMPHETHGGITISVNISKPIIVTSKLVNKSKSQPILKKVIQRKVILAKQENTAQLNTSSHKEQQSETHTIKANGETISNILNKEFKKYFYYPKLAQRRQWQGKVILQFIIMANGSIKKIQVTKSSGYTVLDNAAMGALKKIDTKKEFLVALNGESMEQVLPVIYQLMD